MLRLWLLLDSTSTTTTVGTHDSGITLSRLWSRPKTTHSVCFSPREICPSHVAAVRTPELFYFSLPPFSSILDYGLCYSLSISFSQFFIHFYYPSPHSLIMQQSPATPESPASPPCSGSSTDSAGGVDRSAARILMQLNHNYMKMDDSVANNHGSELATDSAAPAAAAMAPMPPPQQPPQQQQQLQPPPKQQKKLLPNGALFSTGGTICLEPYAAAAVAAQASRSAAATVKAINKSGNLQVKISRFPSTSPYQRPQNQVRQSPSASNVLNQQYQQQRTLLTATATTASSAGQSSHPQSSTSSTDSTTTNTTTTSAPSKRAVRVRTQVWFNALLSN